MASGTLYTHPDNFRAYKVLIAANYGGGKVEVPSDFVFGKTNKTPSFLEKFPLGKVPAFESTDGHLITESNAIAYYVSSEELRGKTLAEKSQIIQWLNFADSELLPYACMWVFPSMGIIEHNEQDVEGGKTEVEKILKYLNDHLLIRTYMVGERISLADIVLACNLLHLFIYVMDPSVRKSYANVTRWFNTIVNQPKVKSVLGNLELCKNKGGNAQQGKEKKGGKDKKQKKEEPEVQEESKGEEEEETGPAPIPKGVLDLEAFKRVYANEEVTVSVPYFWDHFDKENYSIWLGEYKYPEELTKVFMSCNLISGMFQRLDKMRKIAFASVCLFGEENNSSISGIWVWKGQTLAFEQSPDWMIDYETYDWKKLDSDDPKTRELINGYLTWEGTDKKGRKFSQGKIFN